MKADPFGTWSEQVRHAVGWLTPAQAKAQDQSQRCAQCHYYRAIAYHAGVRRSVAVNPSPHCVYLNLATAPGAWCRRWMAYCVTGKKESFS